MIRRIPGGAALALVVLLGACTEELSTPADCPTLCPGTSLIVRDTVLDVNVGQDSSYTGYLGAREITALLVSDGLNAGEARAFASFPAYTDSVTVDGTRYALTVDSAAVVINLVARDSTVGGLKLFAHRVAGHIDTTATLADVDAMITPASLIDSVLVSDTLRRGAIRLVVPAANLGRLVAAPADSGRLGIAFRIKAAENTGLRFGSIISTAGGPTLVVYGRVVVTDTAKQRQTLTVFSDTANYVIEPPPVGNDVLVAGGKLGTRTILRFTVPRVLRDSASVLRATLELTPAGPIPGLRNDPASLQVRGVLADLGAKSPTLAGVSASANVLANSTNVQSVDVRTVVETWFGAANTQPTVLLMGLFPEGASFGRPLFFSSRAPSGTPRLRLTYALPSRPGHP